MNESSHAGEGEGERWFGSEAAGFYPWSGNGACVFTTKFLHFNDALIETEKSRYGGWFKFQQQWML